MLSTSFETNQKKAVVVRRREDRSSALLFLFLFKFFNRKRREDKTQKREEISLVLLTVLSDSINPVVRSTCGGFCALTTVNCAPRLRVVVDFLREMREKASRLVKTYHFASPTPTFCFQFEERKTEREREQTKPIIHRFYTIPLRRRRQSASFAVGGFDGDERRGGDAGSGSKHFFFL